MMKKLILVILCLGYCNAFGQIKGKVTDKNATPLHFVSVLLENSVTGTTTNTNGNYVLKVTNKGNYKVVFQFLGYKTIQKTVSYTGEPMVLNVSLEEEQISLEEVSISSKENPANQIIRNAIANKDKNTDKLAAYKANFYSRGLFKIKNAPKKFLGQELGDFGGGLDSTRSGIVYLSETISKIKYQKKPKRFKEHILASKVSGRDNGISFNQADEVNFNLYENTFAIADAAMISPIADGAFGYYKYGLAGTFYLENGMLVNKIQLLPKRKNDRVFSGYIYVVEEDWAIYGTDLEVGGAQVGIPAVKKLHIKQNYNYVVSSEAWAIVTQTINFEAGMLGFNFNGRFSAAYSSYNFQPNFTENSFDNELLSFAKNATKKDTIYWDAVRPVSLTTEEVSDYRLKDSIQTVRKSKKYLDSIDQKRNKFRLIDLISGYDYDNSYKKWSFGIRSPVLKLNFNTVQGWNSSMGVNFTKRLNEEGKRFSTGINVNYGVSDKRARPEAYLNYKWNNISYPYLRISGGVATAQFNANNPISPFWNTISSVLFERNYMKIYEKAYAKASYSQEITNGIRLFSSFEFADRKPLFNTTDYVMFPQEDVQYTSNNPQEPDNFTSAFTPHQIFSLNIRTSIRFGQKYLSYPNQKITVGNKKYPTMLIGYRKNFGSGENAWDSDFVYARTYQNIALGAAGNFNYNLAGGIFLEEKDIPFIDYAHFNGNRLRVATDDNYTKGFLALPYYALSTNDKYGEIHAEQNFKGALWSKIPLFNKLNFHVVAGAKGLFTGGNKPYSEFSVGLDNVGFGKWRVLRIDFIQSNLNGNQENRIVFGLKL